LGDKSIPVIEEIHARFQTDSGEKIVFPREDIATGSVDLESLWLRQLDATFPALSISARDESRDLSPKDDFPLFSLYPSLHEKLRHEKGTLTLDILGQRMSLKKIVAIPLTETGFVRIPGAIVRIWPTEVDGVRKISFWRVGYQTDAEWLHETFYLLVNPQQNTGSILRGPEDGGVADNFWGLGAWSRISLLQNWELQSETLVGSTLYLYEVTEDGPFATTLTMRDFILPRETAQ
jgi:hypothetical protein